MYLNQVKFWITCIVSGGVTLYFGFMGLLGMMLGPFFGSRDSMFAVDDNSLVAVFVIISTSWLIIAGISLRFFLDALRAYRINGIFERNEDGLLVIEETAELLKMKHYKFFAVFQRLVGKRLMQNCSVFSEDPTCIILANEKYDIRAKFTVERCKNCAAPNTLRIGFEKECKYCGSKI